MSHTRKKIKKDTLPRTCKSITELRTTMARWVKSLDSERRQRPILIVGGREYTPRALLEEIDNKSELGISLTKSLLQLRIVKNP